MKTNAIFFVYVVLTTVSCGQQQENPSEVQTQSDTTAKLRIEDTITEATLEARNNTLKHLSFTQLLQYLPQDIKGYSVEDPINGEDGSIGKSGSRYFSFASKTFSKKDQKVRVEIIDYTPDTVQYQGLLNMYGFNSDIDNNILRTKHINLNIPGTKAITTQYKTEKTAKVIVGAADRVLVVITGMQTQDLNLLQQVAHKIDFRKMIKEVTEKS